MTDNLFNEFSRVTTDLGNLLSKPQPGLSSWNQSLRGIGEEFQALARQINAHPAIPMEQGLDLRKLKEKAKDLQIFFASPEFDIREWQSAAHDKVKVTSQMFLNAGIH